MTASKRGGARPGAGRPKSENPRKLRQIRATAEEWEKIREFARRIKSGGAKADPGTIP